MDVLQTTSGSCEKAPVKLESAFPCDVTSVCRVCLVQDRMMRNIFDPTDCDDSVGDRILYCTGVKFTEEDGLSDKICTLCFTHLTIAHKFKTKCISADDICRKMLQDKNTIELSVDVTSVNTGHPDDEIKVKDERLSETDDDFKDDDKSNNSKLETETEVKVLKKKREYKTRVTRQKKKLKFIRFHCKSCKINFKTKEESESHRKIHKDSESFICEICGKSFIRRSSHYSHIRSHLEPTHECPHCDYKTWQKHDLTKHTRIHTGEKIYQCEYCSSAFNTSSNLKGHTRRNHSSVKSYRFSCSRCDKQYYDKAKFERHMDSHDEIRRHVCDICHSCFTRRCYWKKHLLSQHGITIPPVRPGRRKINILKQSPPDDRMDKRLIS